MYHLHPRTFRKVRRYPVTWYYAPLWFLHPRTSREVWQNAIANGIKYFCLHPRALCEVRLPSDNASLSASVYIHASLWGATWEVRLWVRDWHCRFRGIPVRCDVRGATARYSVWRYAFTISRINIPTQIGLLANNTPYVPLSSANLSGFLVRFGFAQVSQIIISPSLHLKYLLHP